MIDTNSQKNIILILKRFFTYMSTAGYHGYSKKQMLARTRHVKNSEELIKIKRTYSTSEKLFKNHTKIICQIALRHPNCIFFIAPIRLRHS